MIRAKEKRESVEVQQIALLVRVNIFERRFKQRLKLKELVQALWGGTTFQQSKWLEQKPWGSMPGVFEATVAGTE